MRILNLVRPEKSDISFKILSFPDGQHNVVMRGLKKELSYRDYSNIGGNITPYWTNPPVLIKSRLSNWADLEIITCAVATLRDAGVSHIHLYTPYILGARSDRKFDKDKESFEGNNYLKDVICPVINSLNFETITCIDPHSDVLEACIKGFRKLSNFELINFAIEDLVWKQKEIKSNTPLNSLLENIILVSPDAGASKKIYKLAEQIDYKGDIITCSKERDVDGKLDKVIVPDRTTPHMLNKDIIIIDDICDGGQTFINIMDVVNKKWGHCINKKYLIVTHGIFSKGFGELSKYFDGIYSTNSYKDLGDFSGNDLQKTNLKQLNVY